MKASSQMALVMAAVAALSKAETVTVRWGMTLATGEEIITAGLEGTPILASACSNKLTLGDIDIEVTADSNALGVISAGDNQYDLSNDTICSGLWSPRFAEVECIIPWEGELDVISSRSAANSTIKSCFASREEQEVLPYIGAEQVIDDEEDEAYFEARDTSVAPTAPRVLFGRQGGGIECLPRLRTMLANPSYAWRMRNHRQVTGNGNCASANGCTITTGSSVSVTHTASVSLSGAGWITAGYSVAYTTTNIFSFTCPGIVNTRICVKHYRNYQDYDTWEGYWNYCINNWANGRRNLYRIRSPMSHGSHEEHYCARGTTHCQFNGYSDREDRGAGNWPATL